MKVKGDLQQIDEWMQSRDLVVYLVQQEETDPLQRNGKLWTSTLLYGCFQACLYEPGVVLQHCNFIYNSKFFVMMILAVIFLDIIFR